MSLLETIRIDCKKSDLQSDPQYKQWLEQVKTFVAGHVDQTARLRMYAYERGATTLIALDLFCTDSSKDVATTVSITPGEATLMLPVGDQLELSLPGLVEALDFAEHLVSGGGKHSGKVQISPWVPSVKA